MSDVWEHSDRVVCTHPGWGSLRGWGSVSASFLALFRGTQQLQFILTEVHVSVDGDTAFVSLDENILSEEIGGTVASINLFVRDGGTGWRLVVHHGSQVLTSPGDG